MRTQKPVLPGFSEERQTDRQADIQTREREGGGGEGGESFQVKGANSK